MLINKFSILFSYFYIDLLRNIMGLLLNVSQCANLRSRLMRSEYIQRFTYLLDCRNNEIEIGYSAAGILSYIGN